MPLLFALALQTHATAAESRDSERPLREPERGILVLEHENDLVAGNDRNYTSGVRVSWITPSARVPDLLRHAGERIPLFPARGDIKASWSVGQNMYTPRNIEAAVPDPDQRPYAGGCMSAAASRRKAVIASTVCN